MKRHRQFLLAAAACIGLVATTLVASPASGHESENEGHIPANVNYGFDVIGRDTLQGVTDGLYTDVWSHDGFAYIGTFQEPECSSAGVFVVDMAAAIANYPNTDGATVAEIKSPPDTRINDVKVHTVGDTDVLITTEEPCGAGINGGAVSDLNINKPCPIQSDKDGDGIGDCGRANDNGRKNEPGRAGSPGAASQHGRGGISLWDVSDPTKPRPLKKSFLDYRGVHNTFAWSDDNGSYLIGVADTFDFLDTFIVDISNPKKPELIAQTGVLDWLGDGFSFDQLETGQFGAILLHDVWVENIDGVNTAVLSYWDGGFITLDMTDPANPVFLGDSDYPEIDGPTGLPYEGNAHAAVFGGNGDYIFGGDEDFDPASLGILVDGVAKNAGGADFGADVSELVGSVVWTGSEGCSAADVPAATEEGQIALMQRGTCFFQEKAASAEAQGYAGYIVANDAARGDAVLTMGEGSDDVITIPGAFIGFGDGEAIKASLAAGDTVTIGGSSQVFNGWGYLRILNNTGGNLDIPTQVPGPTPTAPIGQLGEIGYYAPAEAVEAPESGDFTEFGDLTMHNVEADPSTQDVVPSFDAGPRMFVSWYSLGMRALEYRPGHYHENQNGEGSYSWNVHEVGRFIAEEGSNFWGVHVDEVDGQQVILGSDRNTGLWIFTFDCANDVDGTFYCQRDGAGGG